MQYLFLEFYHTSSFEDWIYWSLAIPLYQSSNQISWKVYEAKGKILQFFTNQVKGTISHFSKRGYSIGHIGHSHSSMWQEIPWILRGVHYWHWVFRTAHHTHYYIERKRSTSLLDKYLFLFLHKSQYLKVTSDTGE